MQTVRRADKEYQAKFATFLRHMHLEWISYEDHGFNECTCNALVMSRNVRQFSVGLELFEWPTVAQGQVWVWQKEHLAVGCLSFCPPPWSLVVLCTAESLSVGQPHDAILWRMCAPKSVFVLRSQHLAFIAVSKSIAVPACHVLSQVGKQLVSIR